MTDSTPTLDAWLRAQAPPDEFDGYSADEIERMPFAQYSRLRERAGLASPGPYDTPAAPAAAPAPGQDPAGVMASQHPQHASEDPGVEFQAMTMRQYEALRSKYIRPSATARGILG